MHAYLHPHVHDPASGSLIFILLFYFLIDHWGIYNEHYHIFDTNMVWVFDGIFVFEAI